jgi:hypothetical protein
LAAVACRAPTGAPRRAPARARPTPRRRTAPPRAAPRRAAPHRAAPRRAAPHRAAPHRAAPRRAAPRRAAVVRRRPRFRRRTSTAALKAARTGAAASFATRDEARCRLDLAMRDPTARDLAGCQFRHPREGRWRVGLAIRYQLAIDRSREKRRGVDGDLCAVCALNSTSTSPPPPGHPLNAAVDVQMRDQGRQRTKAAGDGARGARRDAGAPHANASMMNSRAGSVPSLRPRCPGADGSANPSPVPMRSGSRPSSNS